MSTYSSNDMKTVEWDEIVHKNKKMYFGEREITGEEIGDALKYPAVVLGAKNTKLAKFEEWYYFCSDIDWLFLSDLKVESVRTVFDGPRPFPEGESPNSYRTESLCLPFSTDVFTLAGDNSQILKGKFPPKKQLEEHLKELGDWGRIVGYKFDKNA